MSAFLLPLGIGFVSGLRSLTGITAVSWAAHYGWLDLHGTSQEYLGSPAAVVIFSVLAFAEYVADKLPRTPNRINAGPLIARMVTGGISGTAIAVSAHQTPLSGLLLGWIGAVIGAYTGYSMRKRLVARLGVKDIAVAIPEDLVAIGLALLIVAGR